MKKIIAGLFLALTTFAFAEVPNALQNEFTDKSATFFDAQDFAKNYSEIKMLNKTAEKIETIIYAYDPKNAKNSTTPVGWVKFGTIKVSDYNDNNSMSKQLKYKVTSMKDFRYFAYTTSRTEHAAKYEISFNNEVFEIRADYEKAVRPLASLEVKPEVEKNPQNKKEVLGVKAAVSFRNISSKTTKNIVLTIAAYDKGLVSRTNDGKEEVSVVVDELVEDGEKYKAETRVFWNNTAISKIKVLKVKITYLDDTEIEYEL